MTLEGQVMAPRDAGTRSRSRFSRSDAVSTADTKIHGNKEGKPMMLELVEPKTHAVLKVIGVGGAGGNAVNGMVQGGLGGCEFVAMNSDAQVLEQSLAPTKIRLGVSATQGLGCGGKPEIGRQAAEESVDELRDAVAGADMVF